jgi:hypothetical protein
MFFCFLVSFIVLFYCKQLNSVCKRDKTLSCKEEYLEIIQNKSAGFLNNFIDIGKVKQDNSYCYFIGIKIK